MFKVIIFLMALMVSSCAHNNYLEVDKESCVISCMVIANEIAPEWTYSVAEKAVSNCVTYMENKTCCINKQGIRMPCDEIERFENE